MVKNLTEDLQGKWHHAYFDNFFTSQPTGGSRTERGSMNVELPRRTGVVSPKALKKLNSKELNGHTS